MVQGLCVGDSYPDDPPAATGLACSLEFERTQPGFGVCAQKALVNVETLDAGPWRRLQRVVSEVWNVWKRRPDGQICGVVNEIVDW